MADRKQSTIRVQCTCCDAILTVDKASGEVVFTEKPKTAKKYSFEDAFQKVKQDQETAEDRFKEAFTKEKDRMKVIDQKFEEAMKRKDELEMPIKPIDLD
jgi:hypothetical protein